jgi:dihydrofolate reductase
VSAPALSVIVALDRRGAIGRAGTMPWHLPDDLRHFRAQTMGKPILMGRRTYDSIGRALPGRRNLVLSRDPGFHAADTERCASLDDALQCCAGTPELMVMGGGELYALALPQAQTLWLTEIDTLVADADTFFPAWSPAEWVQTWSEAHPADARHAYPFTFRRLQRAG